MASLRLALARVGGHGGVPDVRRVRGLADVRRPLGARRPGVAAVGGPGYDL